MADVFDAEKRSEIMRQVKSKKNKSTELRLIEVFKENGITGWRRNYAVKGHPDFVFPKQKIAVFVFCLQIFFLIERIPALLRKVVVNLHSLLAEKA